MNPRHLLEKLPLRWRAKPFLLPLLAGIALLVVLAIVIKSRSAKAPVATYEVKRTDFLISVVEGGTLEAVHEVVIRCEVEGTARVIYIVPEGSEVRKGDLLVELDSSSTQDAVNLQQINVEKAQFGLIQAEQQLAIQKSTGDSEMDAARLAVEFAESDLEKYAKGEALQLRRNAQIEITNVVETLSIAEERLQWSDRLYQRGFETKANLDKDRLTVSQTRLKLEQAQQALWMLETFDEPKKRRELEATLGEARENLERVKLQSESKIAQFEADVLTQKSTLELNKSKLERDLKQLQATKLYAPQDGLVVYSTGGGRFSSESLIEEGAVVRNRQELIKLPDVSEMKLQVRIHESHINQIHRGQAAYVVLDSMPDQRYRGYVNRVAPLPDSQARWGNPNLKVYATEILLSEKPDVKPGVSARAEIVITNLADALTVPIQAVTTRNGKQVVFLEQAPQRPVPVTVGMYNDKFIEITQGLNPGDRVLLSPSFDTDERDLGGAIIADGEAPPEGDTNYAARALREASENEDRGPGRRGPGGRETGGRRAESASGPGGGNRGTGRDESPSSSKGVRPDFDPAADPGPVPGSTAGPERGGRRGRPGAEGASPATDGAPRPDRAEMLKQFDKNGDGQLDETERKAIGERFGRERRRNSPPADER